MREEEREGGGEGGREGGRERSTNGQYRVHLSTLQVAISTWAIRCPPSLPPHSATLSVTHLLGGFGCFSPVI